MAVAADYTSIAQELYIAYFGRPADVVGLNNMTKAMADNGLPTGTADFVAAYSTNAHVKDLVDSFGTSTESANLYGSGTTAAFVNAIFQNLLNRAPAVDGLLFWVNAIDSGTLTKGAAAMNILAAAVKVDGNATDLLNVTNKVTVATNFTTTMTTDAADIVSYAGAVAAQDARDMLKTVTSATDTNAFQPTIDATLAAIVTANNPVVTTVLTTGVDTLVGTSANDTYNGVISSVVTDNATLTALDSIDGKGGQNVLNISDVHGGTALPGGLQVTNVQTVNVQAAGAATIDTTTGFTGLTALNVTRSTGSDVISVGSGTAVNVTDTKAGATVLVHGNDSAVTVNAAGHVTIDTGSSTQTVNTSGGVSLSKATGAVVVVDADQGGADTTITHGTSVSLTTSFDAASEGNTVTIGDGTNNPSGAVTVVANLAGTKGVNTGSGDGNITVNGGTVVNVTENAVQPLVAAPAAGATAANGILTQSNVKINGGAATTTVNVTQTAAVAEADSITAKAGTVQADSFKFVALTSGQTLTVDGLSFTAGTAGTTAAQTAAAFANLTATSTQGNSVLGTYVGTYGGNYTTGAATGSASDTIVFSYKSAAAHAAATVVGSNGASTITGANVTTGTDATDAQAGVGGIVDGTVTVIDSKYVAAGTNTITNVKLDGFGTSVIKSDALTTLSLANALDTGVTVLDRTATTLGLTVNNLTATTAGSASTLNLDSAAATYTTLNIHTAGAASTVNVTAAAVQTLTIDGTKTVDLTGSTFTALKTATISGAAGATAVLTGANVTDVNAAASSGANAITVDASKATYEGGSGVDATTLSSTTVSKAVSLGAGDDSVTLATGTHALTATVDGGTGTDTLVMAAADAAFVTTDTAFESHITGFEKLSLNTSAAGAGDTINLANLNNISYVVSAGGAGTTETAVVTWKAFSGAGTQTIGGMTVTATGSFTAAQVATVAGGGTVSGLSITTAPTLWTVAAASGATNVFTSTTASTNVANVDLVVPAETTTLNTAPTVVETQAGGAGPVAETDDITWQAFAGAGTQSVGGVVITSTGGPFTATQVATVANGGSVTGLSITNAGTFTITANGATGSHFTEAVPAGVDIVVTGAESTTLNTAPTAVTTDGAAVGSLTLTHMANAGTFELNGNASSTTVTMTDATGTADSFNVLLKGAAIAGGTVAVAGVETVNVTATDTNVKHAAGTINDSLTVSDAAVTSIKVLGNANLTLTVTGDTALTSIDASGMTAGLTVTTAGTVAETVKGGAMANHLTAGTGTTADVLIGGAGADVLTANAGRDVLTGGAGNDTFVIHTAAVNVNSYATITDAAKGDIIEFAAVGTNTFKAAAISLDTTATFQDYANAAVNENNLTDTTGHISWFQFGGNTYIVESAHDASSLHDFKNGTDLIVKLTGTVDLSHTSLNTTNVTLLIG